MSTVDGSLDGSSTSGALNLYSPKAGQEEDMLDDTKQFTQGMFGVGYTVAKEKAPTWRFAAFRLFLDFLQLFLLTVNPQWLAGGVLHWPEPVPGQQGLPVLHCGPDLTCSSSD
ncbi:PAS domain-containing protein, partial [Haematococcus lacustris]